MGDMTKSGFEWIIETAADAAQTVLDRMIVSIARTPDEDITKIEGWWM